MISDEFLEHQKNTFNGIKFIEILEANNKGLNSYKGYFLEDDYEFIQCFPASNIPKDGEVYFFSKSILYDFILQDKEKGELINEKISSTYEINNLLKNYNKKFIFFEEEEYDPKHNYLDVKDNKIIFSYNNEILVNFVGNSDKIQKGNNMDLKGLSDYWKLYFKNEKDGNLEYYDTEERKSIKKIFFELQNNNKGFNFFRFTGPVGIGKSLFLFNYSRTRRNVVYLNLKILKKQKNIIYLKNMLIKEFNYIITQDNKLISKINKIFKIENQDYEHIIIRIISYIIKSQTKFIKPLVIIFDQYKSEYFSKLNEIEEIISTKKNSSIKCIICSSIDDGPVRDSCLKLWEIIKYNKISQYYFALNEYQSYFHYIPKLINRKICLKHNNEIYNKICELFNNIPKYEIKFINTESKNLSEKLELITNKIILKMKRFFRTSKKETDESSIINRIVSLKKYTNQKYEIEKLENIISNIPLKYFIIRFYYYLQETNLLSFNFELITHFKIEYSFSYLKDIIDELTLQNQKAFFEKEDYQIHTGATIGGFFEISAIEGLKSSFLPYFDSKTTAFIRVARINEMCQYTPILRDEIKNIMKNQNDNNKIIINQLKYQKLGSFDTKSIFHKLDSTQKMIFEKYLQKDQFIDGLYDNFINKYRPFIKNKNNEILAYTEYDTNLNKTRIFKTTNKKIKNQKDEEDNKTIIIIDNDNNNLYKYKDCNIFITQSIENAPVFDMAYLFGSSQSKTFVGFQMKAYKDRDNDLSVNISRESIIEKSSQLLLTSNFFLDINITEFHYIIVGLYFENDNNDNNIDKNQNNPFKKYSQSLIKHCKENNLQIILYDPKNNKFFDENKKSLDKLILDKISNLNNISERSDPKLSNAIIGKKTQRTINKEYEEFFSLIKKKKIQEDKQENIQENIKKGEQEDMKDDMTKEIIVTIEKFFEKLMALFQFDKIAFMQKNNLRDYLKTQIPLPSKSNLYLFKKKLNEKLNINDNYNENNSNKSLGSENGDIDDVLNNYIMLILQNDNYNLIKNQKVIKSYNIKTDDYYFYLFSDIISLIDPSFDFWIFTIEYKSK